jgi:hypothetical protein
MGLIPEAMAEASPPDEPPAVPAHPGVVGAAVQRGLGVHPQPEVGHVRASEGHGAGVAHALDRHRVGRRHEVLQCLAALGRGVARDVDIGLDGERHPVQRSERTAGLARGVGAVGLTQDLVGSDLNHRVERTVHGVDAREVRLDDLSRRY